MASLIGLVLMAVFTVMNLYLGNNATAAFNAFVGGLCVFNVVDAISDRRRR